MITDAPDFWVHDGNADFGPVAWQFIMEGMYGKEAYMERRCQSPNLLFMKALTIT